ncbi:hypothetical protein [Photobacterium damselae]|uniref:hypothetical protein n=1 Tax=Photobacterium damselae TaxID=38293 RepID=UPI0010760A9E|nr:hypothetical protein [Photobacterium damselae]MBE8127736.1 hypothetical protein [Photobacterium damselae subsp. piscicida]WIH21999.1 hypothetical protein KQY33_20190 [Photobacterium damselae]
MELINTLIGPASIVAFLIPLFASPFIALVQTWITNRSQLDSYIIQTIRIRNLKKYELERILGCRDLKTLKRILNDKNSDPIDTIKHMRSIYPYYKSTNKFKFFDVWLRNVPNEISNKFIIVRKFQFGAVLITPVMILPIIYFKYYYIIDNVITKKISVASGEQLLCGTLIFVLAAAISFLICKYYLKLIKALYIWGWKSNSILIFHKVMGKHIKNDSQEYNIIPCVTYFFTAIIVGFELASVFFENDALLLWAIITLYFSLFIEFIYSLYYKKISEVFINISSKIEKIANRKKVASEEKLEYKKNKKNKEVNQNHIPNDRPENKEIKIKI